MADNVTGSANPTDSPAGITNNTPTPAGAGDNANDQQFDNPELKKLHEEAKRHRLEKNQEAAARLAAETELAEMKRKIAEQEAAQLAEQGKFKELYEASNTELQTLKQQLAQQQTIVDQFQATQKAEHAELLLKIPEDKRDLFKDLDNTKLRAVAETFAQPTNTPAAQSPGGNTPRVTPQTQVKNTDLRYQGDGSVVAALARPINP